MALLFVGGVMNLAWIALLTLLVAAEKLLPGGRWIAGRPASPVLAWGAATALRLTAPRTGAHCLSRCSAKNGSTTSSNRWPILSVWVPS
jgi:hypothetical protein